MMASAQVVETSVNTNNSPSMVLLRTTLLTRTITQTTTNIVSLNEHMALNLNEYMFLK